MQDRVPTYPGRVRLVPVQGQDGVYDMTLVDEATVVGTSLNKATLLTDATAALLESLGAPRPDTVDQAIAGAAGLLGSYQKGLRVMVGTYTGTGSYGSSSPNVLNFPFKPLMIFVKAKGDAGSSTPLFFAFRPETQQVAITLTSEDVNKWAAVERVTWRYNAVEWYVQGGTTQTGRVYQLNSGIYYYVAIGEAV